ncbi:hypothetical protein [Candidatus Mycoplasma haematobovis]|uniref:hypothetical protein n=1 Tax=Candidatus Mycoplasma haematobovis TaxID=432608 RepID=UPI000A4ED9B0|nr:hypothetical protein [Candidatus Mycoplasma haematobovis]
MSSTKAKVGVLGGMGYEIYALTNNTDSVKNYLEKAGLEIIEESNDSFWTKVLETYKLEKKDSKFKMMILLILV